MDGWITIGTKLDTKNFDKQIEDVEEQLKQIDYELSHKKELKLDSRTIKDYELKAEKLTNQLASLRKQQDELNRSSLKEIGNLMETIIKKVGKWGLAVFGVRSAYMFVRQSMSTLSQYDEQLATDLEYIRYIIASTLEPVIKVIVELVYKLLSLLNAVWSRLFGVSLFSKNLAKNFKNAKNQANSLKKTLAGFDEMNVLNADGSTGIALSPSFDPSKANRDIENWLDNTIAKVKNFGQSILNLIPNYLKQGVSLLWNGLINQIAGIALIIKGIFAGNWQDINAGIGAFVKGAGNILKGLITIVSGVINSILNFFGRIGADLWNGLLQGARDAFNGIKNIFKGFGDFFYRTFDSAWSSVKKLFTTGGKIFDGMKEGIVNAFKAIVNALISGINKAIAIPFNKINSLLNAIKSISILGAKPFNNLWSTSPIKVPQIPRLAKGGIVNMPSRGVPVGGAIAGERGQEGVIPLTDSQQMELLGEAIGRHINLSATIPVYAYNRQVAREIRKIELQSNFAMNR